VYEYDDQGRVSKINADSAGIDAETSFTYDGQGQLLTTTSPTGVVTRTERNDFGEVVFERSYTRGDARMEYNVGGYLTKRRETPYNSSSIVEQHCYAYDLLGRRTEDDRDCNSSVNHNLYYDGDSNPSSSCEANTYQAGRLSMYTNSEHKRVLCYHKNGAIHSMYQVATFSSNI
jgi:YD repeat-containing protein